MYFGLSKSTCIIPAYAPEPCPSRGNFRFRFFDLQNFELHFVIWRENQIPARVIFSRQITCQILFQHMHRNHVRAEVIFFQNQKPFPFCHEKLYIKLISGALIFFLSNYKVHCNFYSGLSTEAQLNVVIKWLNFSSTVQCVLTRKIARIKNCDSASFQHNANLFVIFTSKHKGPVEERLHKKTSQYSKFEFSLPKTES